MALRLLGFTMASFARTDSASDYEQVTRKALTQEDFGA
jgi:hypothetical protein